MDDLAQIDGKTPEERGERARAAFELYASRLPGSEIQDLMADLAHLADTAQYPDSGAYSLQAAMTHYQAEK